MTAEVKNIGRYQESVATRLLVGTSIAVRVPGGHCWTVLTREVPNNILEPRMWSGPIRLGAPEVFFVDVTESSIEFYPPADGPYEFTICGEERDDTRHR